MNGWWQFANLSFAIFFGGFVLLGIREACRAYWPVHKERIQAQTRKADADAALAVATIQNTGELIKLTERNTQMHSATVESVAKLAVEMGTTNQTVNAVLRHLVEGCNCDADRKPGGLT